MMRWPSIIYPDLFAALQREVGRETSPQGAWDVLVRVTRIDAPERIPEDLEHLFANILDARSLSLPTFYSELKTWAEANKIGPPDLPLTPETTANP